MRAVARASRSVASALSASREKVWIAPRLERVRASRGRSLVSRASSTASSSARSGKAMLAERVVGPAELHQRVDQCGGLFFCPVKVRRVAPFFDRGIESAALEFRLSRRGPAIGRGEPFRRDGGGRRRREKEGRRDGGGGERLHEPGAPFLKGASLARSDCARPAGNFLADEDRRRRQTRANSRGMPPPSSTLAWTWQEGSFQRADSLPLTDRGFRYGMALFESLRVTDGEPDFFDEHAARLLSACAARGFAIEAHAVHAARECLRHEGRSGFGRLYATAGDGPPDAPGEHPRLFVLLEMRRPPEMDAAWRLTRHEAPLQALFGGLKTANYWFHTDALAGARRRGFDETLLFNAAGELVSASMANVFLRHGDRVSTPVTTSGCRAGVIREWVLQRREVIERTVTGAEVANADEIFLTNSWTGIRPVAELDGRRLEKQTFAAQLAQEFSRRGSS